jgi:hypothetical protein
VVSEYQYPKITWYVVVSYTSEPWNNPGGTALVLSKGKVLMYINLGILIEEQFTTSSLEYSCFHCSTASNDSINSSFLFLRREDSIRNYIIKDHKISSDISSNVFINHLQSIVKNESRFCQSIKFICLEFDDAFNWTRVVICASRILIHHFSFFFFFTRSFIIYLTLFDLLFLLCFSDLAWIYHLCQIWLWNFHFLTVISFDRLIFFFNSWKAIRIFQW